MDEKLLQEIDEPCRALVKAMNRVPGVETIESCCGHGQHPMWIFFRVDSLEDLPPILYWFDACHSGVHGWQVVVTTDCAMSPATFRAESHSFGKQAYDEAAKIAGCINDFVDDLPEEEEEAGG